MLKKGIIREVHVDHQQHFISVPNTDITLVIPERAVREGECKYLYVGVSWEDADRCSSIDGKRRVSPTVVCGPPGTQFNKPVILSFSHCVLYDKNQPSPLTILSRPSTNGTEGEEDKWTECSDEDIRTVIHGNRCLIFTRHFTKYTCVSRQLNGPCECLLLGVMAFHTYISPGMPIRVRIYIGNANPDEKERIEFEERRLNGKLSDATKYVTLHGNADLHVNIKDVRGGYECRGHDQQTMNIEALSHEICVSNKSFLLTKCGEDTGSCTYSIYVYQGNSPDGRNHVEMHIAVTNTPTIPAEEPNRFLPIQETRQPGCYYYMTSEASAASWEMCIRMTVTQERT
ncbi:UNC5C-like protein [Ptychodera flava]|uniref:UNC5C-like protein n=1 Tax=Ptychodera flava TaxID=63121 RepID=UPI00396A4CDC